MTRSESERVGDLIDFLQAFHAQRYPPVHNIAEYSLELIRDTDLPTARTVRLTPGGGSWLTVDFVDLPVRPDVPTDLASFLPGGSAITARVRPAVELPEDPTEEDLEAAERAERWVIDVWRPWSEAYLEAAAAKDLYRRLFELRDRLANDRDGLELVWGFGRLLWDVQPGDPVDHPLLTFPVEVEPDAAMNQLLVRPAGALAVESVYLSDIGLNDQVGFNEIRDSLENKDAGTDPWDEDVRSDLVRRILRCIDHDGSFEERVTPGRASGDARADASWVLFLRRRNPDYQGFLERMRELYRDGAAPPDPLKALVIDEPSSLIIDDGSVDRPLEPLLLPLPTNEEQQRIMTLAQRRPGVTVQGPPGTGKSHTIANIISHYVAYGKRVLVVAEKEQALRVLADKIPPGIRDLTVSVLGADEEGRRGLESAINKIQVRVTALDRRHADDEIERLTADLDAVDRKVAMLTDKLLATRAAEVQVLPGRWCGIDAPTPSQAAELVAHHAGTFGFIPDQLAPGTALPLTTPELSELVELVRRVGLERAEACAFEVPLLTALPVGTHLADLYSAVDQSAAELESARPELTDVGRVDAADPVLVADLARDVGEEHEWALKCAGSWLGRVASHLSDPQLAGDWPKFLDEFHSEREQILTLNYELEAHHVVIPDAPPPSFGDALYEAQQRLINNRGKLGLFANRAKQALDACRVDGRVPSTVEDVGLCLRGLRRGALRRQLVTRWTNRMARVDGPVLEGPRPEDVVGPLLDDLSHVLDTPRAMAQPAHRHPGARYRGSRLPHRRGAGAIGRRPPGGRSPPARAGRARRAR